MADELIEKVALAMYAALEGFSSEAVAADYWRCNDENDNAARTNNRYRRAAAAVIRTLLRTMETPSERMVEVGEWIIIREFSESSWGEARDMAEGLVPQPIYLAMLRQFARKNGVEMEERDG